MGLLQQNRDDPLASGIVQENVQSVVLD